MFALKKLLLPLLVPAMLTVIAACGGGEATPPATPVPTPTPLPTPTPPPTATPTPRPTPGPTPTRAPTATAIPFPTPAPTPQPAQSAFSTQRPRRLALDCRPHSFPQRTQASLAVDPTDDRKLYICVEQEGFFKSTDGGTTWQRASNGIKAWERLEGPGLCYEEFYSTIIDPRDPNRICMSMAGGPGTIRTPSSAGNNGVYCSRDAGDTWTQMITCGGEFIKESRDGGRTWTERSRTPGFVAWDRGVPTDIEWSRTDPSTVFLAGPYATVYKSTDGGATWTQILSSDRLPRQ